MKAVDSVIVSVDFSNGKDKGVLLVGRKLPGHSVEVINAFSGKEAEKMWDHLVTIKKGVKNMSSDNEYKEVYFHQYCKTCKNEKLTEQDETCNYCLDHPINLQSHKPVNWEEKKK